MSAPSYAATCLPGLPCPVDKTENDPFADGDGPNVSGKPNADKSTSDACDADFMNQIYARAFLEAEREVILSSVSIRKPDSVLEYTCFDQMPEHNAESFSPLFSHNDEFKTDAEDPDREPSKTIKTLFPDFFTPYIDSNFANKFLGRSAFGDLDHTADTDGPGYNCDLMDSVHQLAKCMDFDQDGHRFYSLQELADNVDPRALPSNYACTTNGVKENKDLIKVARNEDLKYVHFDVWNEYDELAYGTSCGPALETGVTAQYTERGSITGIGNILNNKIEFNVKFCVDPTCYYKVAKGAKNGTCVKK